MDLSPPLHTRMHKRIGRLYDLAHLLVDFMAAALFVIGSVMFFFEAWLYPGTWCFLIGSIFFAVKPTLRLVRAFHLGTLPQRPESL